ncbi:MAG: GDP-mannose 4,6-dehydratase [Vicinamibacterales bacterium]
MTSANSRHRTPPSHRPVLITGGAGFIATNLAQRLIDEGREVVLFDNLSRPGVERNVAWLQQRYGNKLTLCIGDIRDINALRRAARGARDIYHFAAQVAVTTSLTEPLEDFEVNARGTLNLLEIAREQSPSPSIVFTSTNKVYGSLGELGLAEHPTRYVPVDDDVRQHGISERHALAFHSPYGCSKGAADQYVLDYAKTFGLHAVVLRMSCIYGPHQCGNEDQGWVAHFLAQALAGRALTIYGDGRQVRDVLFVSDLTEALVMAQRDAAALAGHAFNIGGGPGQSTSLLELIDLVGRLTRRRVACKFAKSRAADQRFYVTDFRRFQQATGWKPVVSLENGVTELLAWLHHGRGALSAATAAS